MTENDELVHFGVKGMRWGVRKAIERVSESYKKSRESRERNMAEKEASRPKRMSEMTNEELQKAINRLNLETQYGRLSSEKSRQNKGRIAKGRDYALGMIGRQVEKQVGKAIAKSIDKGIERYGPVAVKMASKKYSTVKDHIAVALASTEKTPSDFLREMRGEG